MGFEMAPKHGRVLHRGTVAGLKRSVTKDGKRAQSRSDGVPPRPGVNTAIGFPGSAGPR